MMGRGSSNLIQFGKIVVSGEEKVDDLKQVLYDILEKQGYPEQRGSGQKVTVEDGVELPGKLTEPEDAASGDAAEGSEDEDGEDEEQDRARDDDYKDDADDVDDEDKSEGSVEPDPVRSILTWAASKGKKSIQARQNGGELQRPPWMGK